MTILQVVAIIYLSDRRDFPLRISTVGSPAEEPYWRLRFSKTHKSNARQAELCKAVFALAPRARKRAWQTSIPALHGAVADADVHS